MLKRTVSLTLALLLLFAVPVCGCRQTSSASRPDAIAQDTILLEVTTPNSFISSAGTFDAAACESWASYMLAEYKTEFKLYSESVKNVSDFDALGDRSGLVYVPDGETISELAAEGKILPLNSYLEKNALWNMLPQEYREQFIYGDEIYAIPYSQSIESFTRAFAVNTVWLEQLGAQTPRSADDLAALARKIAAADMNGDGTVGNDYLLGTVDPFSNAPLMNAYGVYFDYHTPLSIAYDPDDGIAADALLDENAAAALNILRQLYEANAFDPTGDDTAGFSSVFENSALGNYGIVYVTDSKALASTALSYAVSNYERITGKPFDYGAEALDWASKVYEILPPLSSQSCALYTKTAAGYVLTTDTTSPADKVNRFVELVYAQGEAFLDCNFGRPTEYTLRSDNSCYVPDYIEGSDFALSAPLLGGLGTFSMGESFSVTSDPDMNAATLSAIGRAYNDKIESYIDNYEATGYVKLIPERYLASPDSLGLNTRRLFGAYRTLVTGLTAGTDVASLLAEYRTAAEEYGVYDTLAEYNAKLQLAANTVK